MPDLADLRTTLQAKLPEHTFKAVMFRAEGLPTEEQRTALLVEILEKREAAERTSSTTAL